MNTSQPTNNAPEPATIPDPVVDRIEAVVRERIIDVLGTFLSQKWFGHTADLADESPAVLAAEIGVTLAASVGRHFRANPHVAITPLDKTRLTTVILTGEEVRRLWACNQARGGGGIQQLRYEASWTPGWPYKWVISRLRKVEAVPAPGDTAFDFEALVSVELHDDGSATATFSDGRTVSTGVAPLTDLTEGPVTRRYDFDRTYLPLSFLPEPFASPEDSAYATAKDLAEWGRLTNHDHTGCAHFKSPESRKAWVEKALSKYPVTTLELIDDETTASAPETPPPSFWSMTSKARTAWVVDFIDGLDSRNPLDEDEDDFEDDVADDDPAEDDLDEDEDEDDLEDEDLDDEDDD